MEKGESAINGGGKDSEHCLQRCTGETKLALMSCILIWIFVALWIFCCTLFVTLWIFCYTLDFLLHSGFFVTLWIFCYTLIFFDI